MTIRPVIDILRTFVRFETPQPVLENSKIQKIISKSSYPSNYNISKFET